MTTKTPEIRIDGLFVGQPQDHWPGKPRSAIHKDAADGPLAVTSSGFEQDQQADLTVHGDADKALHHYPADHYPQWIAKGMIPAGTAPAAFGENISTRGLTETDVCIGDVFRLGTALVQISQGRQPCWKLNAHTRQDQMAYHFQKTGWTGWYYRILQAGLVDLGDHLTLIERPQPKWTLAEVTNLRLTRRVEASLARDLSALPELAEGWQAAFASMAAGHHDEDMSRRLDQPSQ